MAVIGRPREFDREVALNAAMLAFWRKGFVATSMSDLCDAMGIRSPSLYAAFGSKEALFLEAVDSYARTVGPPIWSRLMDGPTVRAGIKSFLLAAAENLPEAKAKPAGCMAALGAVSEGCPGEIQEVMRKIRLDCLDLLRLRMH